MYPLYRKRERLLRRRVAAPVPGAQPVQSGRGAHASVRLRLLRAVGCREKANHAAHRAQYAGP